MATATEEYARPAQPPDTSSLAELRNAASKCTACHLYKGATQTVFGEGPKDAAIMLGINTLRYKVVAFVLSAVFPGVCGGIYASWVNYIDPTDVYDVLLSVKPIVMVLLGGVGTVMGGVYGAVLFLLMEELVWRNLLQFHAGLLGIILERCLIRFLYGRPLETLLATWGVSLVMQQAVRSVFGSPNKEVSNPSWMTGGFDPVGGFPAPSVIDADDRSTLRLHAGNQMLLHGCIML